MSTAIEHVWRQVRNVYSQDPRLLKWKGDFDALLLSEHDIRRLYSIFRRIDVDSGGTIDIMEMFMFLDIERTPFTVQVFSIMDEVNCFCYCHRSASTNKSCHRITAEA